MTLTDEQKKELREQLESVFFEKMVEFVDECAGVAVRQAIENDKSRSSEDYLFERNVDVWSLIDDLTSDFWDNARTEVTWVDQDPERDITQIENKTADNLSTTFMKNDQYHRLIRTSAMYLQHQGKGHFKYVTSGVNNTLWRDNGDQYVRVVIDSFGVKVL